MSKDEIVKRIADEADLTQKKAKVALDAVINCVTESLVKKEKVTFTGFGSFSVASRSARKGKNPKTMEVINIPAKNVPVFRAGKTLKDSIK